MAVRCAVALVLLVHGSAALAQSAALVESPKPGDCSRYSIELNLTGHLTVAQENGKEQIRLEAKARQVFSERILAVDGLPVKSARHYAEATASTLVSGDRFNRTLPADRRLIATQRDAEGLFCYSPAGPLTRDELDLVTEHFDPQCLAGLLPRRELKVGESWPVGDAAAHAASLLDSLVKNGLTGKLTGVSGGTASFAIEGTVEGIENGAKVTIAVSAAGRFDLAGKHVVELTWKQTDEREAGPVSPASKIDATVVLKREPLDAAPKELDEAAVGAIPRGEPPANLTRLRHIDSRDRYRLDYPRDWHITGETDPHLVLRLLDRKALAVQATITAWKAAEPGKHATAVDLKKAIAEAPGWVADQVLDDGEVTIDGGRWLYRYSVAGRIRDVPVVQRFHLLAGPGGDQVVVTITLPPEQARAVGTRDLELVRSIVPGEPAKPLP
jgi:hypothetical protein